jgi:hypothetical protein
VSGGSGTCEPGRLRGFESVQRDESGKSAGKASEQGLQGKEKLEGEARNSEDSGQEKLVERSLEQSLLSHVTNVLSRWERKIVDNVTLAREQGLCDQYMLQAVVAPTGDEGRT